MKKLADAGFTAVEPLYSFPNDPALLPGSPIPSFLKTIMWNDERVAELLPRLQQMGLTVSSMHVGFLFGKDVKEGCEELIALAEKTGMRRFMTSLEFDTEEKAESAAKLMNTAADILQGSGVTLGYHNHSMEFKTMSDGKTLMESFLRNTRAEVQLQLDVGWQMYGGSDVVSFIKQYKDRIISLHLKDFTAEYETIAQEEAFAALGEGVLPTAEILSLLPELHLMEHGLMIDQDRAAKSALLSEDLNKGAHYLKAHLN
jgi:sugar phosphate isomerase/epimerase